ncbi:MAG: glycoside hydrolase family 3 N-terminal domain-containing protein [Planctomycetota bacterium]
MSELPSTTDAPDRLTTDDRSRELVGRMTIGEKVSQLLYTAPAIERLGIPAYNWWNECLHGLARAGRATVFPQTIGIAASFNRDLTRRVADTIATEARARHHATARETGGHTGQYQGLTFWTPNINIFRDPRWGRGQETWGEDPFLTAELATQFVKGLQGEHPNYLKVAACAKHFAVHSGPEELRHEFDAHVGPRDLWETYLPAFERLVAEGVESVMGAYNRVNGEPACAHTTLLGDILRDQWGFEGHVVSDCWAIKDFHLHHKVTKSAVESAALAINQGCDLNCGEAYSALLGAIDQGLVDEETIDRSVTRLMRTRIKLGQFDDPESVPFTSTSEDVAECDTHRRLALETASESIVLLKNNGVLPLREDLRRIFLVGPNAASIDALLGNYSGLGRSLITLAEGLCDRLPARATLEYRHGYQLHTANTNPVDWSPHEAENADVTIFAAGLSILLEGEEGEALASHLAGDREDIRLPHSQVEGINNILRTGARVVLVLFSGSPIALGDLAERVDAIVWVGYPGCEGGRAVAEMLYGDTNPAGRLPVTWPKSVDDLPDFEDYAMAGRTHRYATTEPAYPFGFGLSYSEFEYRAVWIDETAVDADSVLTVTAEVANMSDRDGDEVVQVYTRRLDADEHAPRQSLRGFERVRIPANDTTRVEFQVPAKLLAEAGETGERVVHPGTYDVIVAGQAPTPAGPGPGITTRFEVCGPSVKPTVAE